MRSVLPVLAAAAALLSAPAIAAAAPPDNDNYLSSLPVDNLEFRASVDTTEATTQPDLFNPSRTGAPLSGGGAEPLDCNGTAFGKTVWYDLAPAVDGGVQLRATAGFQTAVAVYEWDGSETSPTASKIKRRVACSPNAGVDDLLFDVKGKRNYTIQVGGVGGAGGPVALSVDFFADRDGDGVLDALDKCVKVPGVSRYGGCPPQLQVAPSLGFDAGGGIAITRLNVDRVPKGAKVTARCTGCGSQTVKAKRFGRVSLSKLVGKRVAAGGTVELRVTLGHSGKGQYKFGATGAYFKWPVRANGLGPRLTRCLNVKSAKIERCK
ncbi:MAG TPA: hypothetical protein VNS09_12080 [Solirubrobacter sp.]|nr:hypothetical protein [Solirubrobacter sp.]